MQVQRVKMGNYTLNGEAHSAVARFPQWRGSITGCLIWSLVLATHQTRKHCPAPCLQA